MKKIIKILTIIQFSFLFSANAQIFTGTIHTPNNQVVEGVTITAKNTSTQASITVTSNNDGTFTIDVAEAGDYELSFEPDVNPLNGVSTFDLVLISKHILNILVQDSYYSILAMDINGNGMVTVFDLIYLRQFILGIDFIFPVPAWRFLEAMDDPTDFVPLPEVDTLHFHVDSGETKVLDIIAVKVGDVNGSFIGG